MATMAYTPPPGAKRAEPHVPVGHPDFKWTPGADVQATWRKYGWTPPSEGRSRFFDDTPNKRDGK